MGCKAVCLDTSPDTFPGYTIEMDKKRTALTGLLQRDNAYYFQARIPLDCQAHYPKAILRERLSAADLRAAKALVTQRWAELHSEFTRIRSTGSKSKTQITPADAQKIIMAALQSRLVADEQWRSAGVDDSDFDHIERIHSEADQSERAGIARGHLDDHAKAIISDWLVGHGYEIAVDSPEFVSLGRQFLKAQAAGTRAMEARHRGDWVETEEVLDKQPKAPLGAPDSSKAPLLSKVVQYFLDNYDQTIPMYAKHRAALNLLLQCIDDVPVDRLRQMDIENFSKLLCRLPPRWSDIAKREGVTVRQLAEADHPITISPKTFEYSYLASLRPFLAESRRVFGDAGFPANLTTEGLKYRGDRKEGERKQRAFTAQELKRLFEGPEMKSFAMVEQDHCKFWLPLIGLYTGARVNEICQLIPQGHIRQEAGIWLFDFTEDGEGDDRIRRSLKNAPSVRTVPIHPHLIELGFLDYVESVKRSGSKLLFPSWVPTKGRASGSAEKWFRSFLNETGLRDETPGKTVVGMHAFRHTLLNRALNLGVLGAEAITGHVGEKSAVVRGYEGELSLTNKYKIISRITFDLELHCPT